MVAKRECGSVGKVEWFFGSWMSHQRCAGWLGGKAGFPCGLTGGVVGEASALRWMLVSFLFIGCGGAGVPSGRLCLFCGRCFADVSAKCFHGCRETLQFRRCCGTGRSVRRSGVLWWSGGIGFSGVEGCLRGPGFLAGCG